MKKNSNAKPAPKRRVRSGLSESDVEAFVAENGESLNASIKRARAEIKQGVHSSRGVKEIAAAGAKRFRSKGARAAR